MRRGPATTLLRALLCAAWGAAPCACGGPELPPEPQPLIELDGACEATLRCVKGLHCTAGRCIEPVGEEEMRATKIAELERMIARTRYLEAKAYTQQGKRKMQAERAELEAELAQLGGGPAGPQ